MSDLSYLIVLSAVPEGRMFGLDSQTLVQIIANLINVGLLAFILSKLLYKPVREFMAKRSERIRSQLDYASDEAARAAELKAQYEQKLKEIGRERDAIMDDARKKAAEAGRNMTAEAKTEADAIRARAQAGVEAEWERAQAELKQAILEVSAAMAEKIMANAVGIGKEAHEKLLEETMAELEGTSWRD